MPVYSRLIFATAATLLLSNCGLISTALRLAPYALMFADENDHGTVAKTTLEMRAREVHGKRRARILPVDDSARSLVAFKR